MRPNEFAVMPSKDKNLESAKRTRRERQGIHSWHPYYAGYSERFVESALNYLAIGEGASLLDPWGGSGTTAVVAARRGIASINIEINPVMSIFGAAKCSTVIRSKASILSFFQNLAAVETRKVVGGGDHLEAMLSNESAHLVRGLIERIPRESLSSKSHSPNGQPNAECPVPAFHMAVFFVAIRKLSSMQKMANPTWLKASDERLHIELPTLAAALQETCVKMLEDLESFYNGATCPAPFKMINADVRRIPLQSATVDRVITSPPYLTRIDYAVSTLPEMMFLGGPADLEAIRHDTMGAPVIKKIAREQRNVWGSLCNDLLDSIANHGSKAAKSYYWKNIIQYFMDMEDSLTEIGRVMASKASGLIVVQSSYFKEHEIPLGEIYVQMCRNLGFDAHIAFREEVKTHMAHVNTKSSMYVKNKVYHEDFVYFSKR